MPPATRSDRATWERETCGQLLGAEEVRDVWIEEVFIILDCESQPVP